MGNKADIMGRSILNIGIVFLHALDRHMDNKTDPVGGPIFNLHCCLHALNSIRVTKNNPRSDQYSTCVCFLRVVERHMANTADPMGGSTFNMCIAFYTH